MIIISFLEMTYLFTSNETYFLFHAIVCVLSANIFWRKLAI